MPALLYDFLNGVRGHKMTRVARHECKKCKLYAQQARVQKVQIICPKGTSAKSANYMPNDAISKIKSKKTYLIFMQYFGFKRLFS